MGEIRDYNESDDVPTPDELDDQADELEEPDQDEAKWAEQPQPEGFQNRGHEGDPRRPILGD